MIAEEQVRRNYQQIPRCTTLRLTTLLPGLDTTLWPFEGPGLLLIAPLA